MKLWVLTLFLISPNYGELKDVQDLIQRFEASIRAQEYDSIKLNYQRLRKLAKDKNDFLGDYISGLAIFKMLTADSSFRSGDFLDSAIYFIERSISRKQDFSDSYVLLGSLYGLKITGNFTRAISLGKKSEEAFEKAKQLDPSNPRIYYLYGTGLFFRPKSFGGSQEKAKHNFITALNFYKKETNNPLSWGYLECKAFLGYAYEKTGFPDSAKIVYREILKEDSNYKWVKQQLNRMKN